MKVWALILIWLSIWLLIGIFIHLAKRKFGKCQKCPHYGEATIYPRKCYYEPQCIWGWIPVFLGLWRIKKEIDKDKNSKGRL